MTDTLLDVPNTFYTDIVYIFMLQSRYNTTHRKIGMASKEIK